MLLSYADCLLCRLHIPTLRFESHSKNMATKLSYPYLEERAGEFWKQSHLGISEQGESQKIYIYIKTEQQQNLQTIQTLTSIYLFTYFDLGTSF